MKYSILSLLFFMSVTACTEQRQMEEEESSSYNDFFMSRSDRAKDIKDQNYSASPHRTPEASPIIEESGMQREEEDSGVLEGIIPEGQEEDPYFESDGEREEIRDPHGLESEDPYYLEDEEIQEEEESDLKFYTPEEVREWR